MIARSLEDLPHDSAQPRPRTCQSAVRVASSYRQTSAQFPLLRLLDNLCEAEGLVEVTQFKGTRRAE
jgi:hypothetical protein